jgi:hypothetical protein
LTKKGGLAYSSNSGNAAPPADESMVLEAHAHVSGGAVNVATRCPVIV